MALKTVLDNFAKARAQYEAALKTHGDDFQKEIASAIAAVLPIGYVFTWTQCTPYFCDGDPCVFGVNSAHVHTTKQFEEESGEGCGMGCDIDIDRRGIYGGTPELKELLAPVAAVWSQLDTKENEPLMLKAFGDHARVIVKTDGSIEREDYDHD